MSEDARFFISAALERVLDIIWAVSSKSGIQCAINTGARNSPSFKEITIGTSLNLMSRERFGVVRVQSLPDNQCDLQFLYYEEDDYESFIPFCQSLFDEFERLGMKQESKQKGSIGFSKP